MQNRILIIDDEENIVKLLTVNLMCQGYEVLNACDGEEGMQKIDEYLPNVVILDIRMPKIGGWEICRKLKTDPKYKNISVIILTASAQKEDRNKAVDIGADRFISKPVDIKKLIEEIKALVRNKN